MSAKNTAPIAFRFLGGGYFPGVPRRDLTQREYDALPAKWQREIDASAIYETVDPPAPISLDPLGELTDPEYEALSPADKGARTREAKKQAEEAEASAAAGAAARQDAEQQAGNSGQEGNA